MSERPVPPRQLWLLALGFGIWASALVTMYALHSVGCAFRWPGGALRLSLAIVLLAYLAAIAWWWRNYASATPDPAFGPTGTFIHWVVLWTLIAAFAAAVFTLGPTLLLTTCV